MTELPFYHSTVFTQPNPTAQAKIDEEENLETYFHEGYEKQYKVINRNNKKKNFPLSSHPNKEYSVSLENGHSFIKFGAPTEGNIEVVKKENGLTQRELRKINVYNGEQRTMDWQDQNNQFDEEIYDQYDDYDRLIKQGTITEFLKI